MAVETVARGKAAAEESRMEGNRMEETKEAPGIRVGGKGRGRGKTAVVETKNQTAATVNLWGGAVEQELYELHSIEY